MADSLEFAAVLFAAAILIHFTGLLFWQWAYNPDPNCVRTPMLRSLSFTAMLFLASSFAFAQDCTNGKCRIIRELSLTSATSPAPLVADPVALPVAIQPVFVQPALVNLNVRAAFNYRPESVTVSQPATVVTKHQRFRLLRFRR